MGEVDVITCILFVWQNKGPRVSLVLYMQLAMLWVLILILFTAGWHCRSGPVWQRVLGLRWRQRYQGAYVQG